jgi:autotransporter-associated beta strand protein
MTSAQLNSAAGIRVASGAAFVIDDDANGTWSLATGGKFVLNGTGISSGGALRQQGSGTFTTTFNREVELQSDSTIFANVATATISITGNVTGTGRLTKDGAGSLTLSGTNTYSGGTTVADVGTATNTGSLRITTGANLSSGAVTAGLNANYGTAYATGGNAFLFVNNTAAATVANNIVISSGDATTRYYNLMKAAASASTGTDLALSGVISGGGTNTVLQLDSNTGSDSTTSFTLSGANTIGGQVRLNRGALIVANASALGMASLYLQTNANSANGNLRFSGVTALANNITIGSNSPTQWINTGAADITLSGVISNVTNSPGFSKMGTGSLVLTGANTYTGLAIGVADGTLAITGSGRLNSGAYTGTLALTASTSTLDYASSTDQTLSGVVSGSGRIVKSGASVLTLGGNNTYTGTTTVNAGTLLVNGNQSAADGAVTVANGATLGGTGTLGGATTVLGGGNLQAGVDGVGTLGFARSVTIESGGTVRAEINSATSDTLNLSGGTVARSLTLATGSNLNLEATTPTLGTTFTLANLGDAGLNFGNYAGGEGVIATYTANSTSPVDTHGVNVTVSGFDFSSGNQLVLRRTSSALVLEFSPVPEPATVLVAAVGLAAVGRLLRRKYKKRQTA